MVDLRWTKLVLDLILLLQFRAIAKQRHPSLVVRDGGEVALPCEGVINGHLSCDGAEWLFSPFPKAAAVELVVQGQIHKKAGSKSGRLSVAENCSLVIKKVSAEDVGLYFCLLQKSEDAEGPKPHVHLSVVTMSEHEADDGVTLNCSVSTRGQCKHTVKWHFSGEATDDLRTSQSYCSAHVTMTTAGFIYTSQNHELLRCSIRDGYTEKVHQFTLSPEPSGRNKNAQGNNHTTNSDWWWLYVLVAVGVAALVLTVAALIRWKRNKGRTTPMDEITAAPEDGVSYASVTFTQKFNSKRPVCGGDSAVTYSSVKASSSPVRASADHNNLYATINQSKIQTA